MGHKSKEQIQKSLLTAGFVIVMVLLAANQLYNQMRLTTVEVSTVQVRAQDLDISIFAKGSLYSPNQKEYYADAESTVKEIRKTAGSSVTIGEPIILLDNKNAMEELVKAESAYTAQQNAYLREISDKVLWLNQMQEARKRVERMQRYYDTGQATLDQVEAAKTLLTQAEQKLAATDIPDLEAKMKRAEKRVQQARNALSATVITSPFNGIILKNDLTQGQLITPGMFLICLARNDGLVIQSELNNNDALQLRIQQKVDILYEALAANVAQGNIISITPLENTDKSSVAIKLDRDSVQTLSGSAFNIRIPVDITRNALVVPKEAVVQREGKNVVFKYNAGVAVQHEVTLGLTSGNLVQITAGVAAGDSVILAPSDKIIDKTKVELLQ